MPARPDRVGLGIAAIVAAMSFQDGMVKYVSVGMPLWQIYVVRSPAIIATFDYAYLGFAAFWGFVIFSDTPDLATVVGTLLIAGAGLLVVRPPAAAARSPAAGATG